MIWQPTRAQDTRISAVPALEALAAEAYSKEVLLLEQIRRMLGLGSLWEAQAMLSRHAVWPNQSAEEILADARRLFEFR